MLKERFKQSIGHLSVLNIHDHRSSARHEIDTPVMYRTEQMQAFESAVIKNISETGVLISTNRKIELGSRIHAIIPEDGKVKQPVHLIVTIVREAGGETEHAFAYGCRIEQLFGLN
jgi:hypothetical protein